MENEPKTEIEKKEAKAPARLITVDTSEFSGYLDTARFDQIWRVAQMFAGTQIVPTHYQNKPNDCFVAAQMAIRLGVDPLMFMQNTFIVHGKPGMEAKLVIALINTSGLFEDSLQWRFEGEGAKRKCTAFATKKKNKQLCEASVDWGTVVGEGSDKNSKWKTMPDQMFKYRTATFFARLHCPETTMGMQTVDELVDVLGDEGEAPKETKRRVGGVTNSLTPITPERKATVSKIVSEPVVQPTPEPESQGYEEPVMDDNAFGDADDAFANAEVVEPEPVLTDTEEKRLIGIMEAIDVATNRADLAVINRSIGDLSEKAQKEVKDALNRKQKSFK